MSTDLAEMFAGARAERRAVLLPYLTAGLPSPADSADLFVAMAQAGADGFEVGIPYADPLMDGPTIQEAGERALAVGSGVDVALEIVAEVRDRTGKPVIVMTYVNPILRVGIDQFVDRVAAAGGSGLIVADLPVDEAEPFAAAGRRAGIGLVLFVAPTTTTARLERVAAARPPFIYGIAEVGVTGERSGPSVHAAQLVRRIREQCDIPVVLGVGISTPEQAVAAAAVADGVIVGSALVARVLAAADKAEATASLSAAVADLSRAVRSAR